MPHVIVKVGDRYGLWSTVSDSPVGRLLPRTEFEANYRASRRREFEEELGRELAERMERADRKGTSSQLDGNAESVMRHNRCGPKEGRISVAEVVRMWEEKPQ